MEDRLVATGARDDGKQGKVSGDMQDPCDGTGLSLDCGSEYAK